jgi:hypothetical protein
MPKTIADVMGGGSPFVTTVEVTLFHALSHCASGLPVGAPIDELRLTVLRFVEDDLVWQALATLRNDTRLGQTIERCILDAVDESEPEPPS